MRPLAAGARPAVLADGSAPGPRENRVLEAAGRQVVRALKAVFNVLALNLVLVVACLPVVTLPLAFQAATDALRGWRERGEDRVVREFLARLRSGSALRTSSSVGAPLLAAAVAAEEVHYFARGGSPVDWTSLGLGATALVLALATVGYVLAAGGSDSPIAPSDLWYLSLRLAVRNLLPTGPLFVAEFVAAALLLLLDPALALLGVPLGLVWALSMTAGLGMRRAGPAALAPGPRRGVRAPEGSARGGRGLAAGRAALGEPGEELGQPGEEG